MRRLLSSCCFWLSRNTNLLVSLRHSLRFIVCVARWARVGGWFRGRARTMKWCQLDGLAAPPQEAFTHAADSTGLCMATVSPLMTDWTTLSTLSYLRPEAVRREARRMRRGK